MPPKMYKKWMHRELEAVSMGGVREASSSPWSWSHSSSGGGQELDNMFRGTAGIAEFYRSMCFVFVRITKSPCLIILYHR